MAAMSSYDQVGKVEDVSDIITNISPTKTPFQTMIGTDTCHNIQYNWQEDSLIDDEAVAQTEGANAPAATWQATVMRDNTTQIFTKVAQVTGTTDAIKTYGRNKELAYQLMLRSKELKIQLERALVGTGQVKAFETTPGARTFAGVQAMIDTSVRFVAGTGAGIGYTGSFPTRAAVTEQDVKTLMQTLFEKGAEPDTMMIKPGDADWAASLAAATGRTRYLQADEKTVVNVVDFYQTPWGKLKFVMNRFLRGAKSTDTQSDALVFESAMWKRVILRDWFRQTLAKVGDSTQVQIIGEFGLSHRNFLASGLITNLA